MRKVEDPRRDQALEIFLKKKGAITNREIAKMVGIDNETIGIWKYRDKWEEKLPEKYRKKAAAKKQLKKIKKETCAEEVKSVIENPELTDEQRLFCLYYIKTFNASKSYQRAFGCGYPGATTNGWRLLQRDYIKREIERLRKMKCQRAFLSEEDIFQKYIDIAFSDITDFVKFGQEEVPVMTAFGPLEQQNSETGEIEIVKQNINTVKLNESNEVDGSLLAEIKSGKSGVNVKLLDKLKALDWLAAHMDMATAEQAAKVKKLQLENEKLRIELEQLKGEERSEKLKIIDDIGERRSGDKAK